jgi:hypothetical protein
MLSFVDAGAPLPHAIGRVGCSGVGVVVQLCCTEDELVAGTHTILQILGLRECREGSETDCDGSAASMGFAIQANEPTHAAFEPIHEGPSRPSSRLLRAEIIS